MRTMRYSSISPLGISVTLGSQIHLRTHRQFGVFAGTPQERHPPEAVSSQSGNNVRLSLEKVNTPFPQDWQPDWFPYFGQPDWFPCRFDSPDMTPQSIPSFDLLCKFSFCHSSRSTWFAFFPTGIWIEARVWNTHVPRTPFWPPLLGVLM